jgi:3-methyladenine DNA glycosylase AlkC
MNINIEYYTKLFFNEETGKERYGFISKEAENICRDHSVDKCWDIAMECYHCELYYIQMFAVSILGSIACRNKDVLPFLKNTVSKNSSWQVQEFLATAFNNYCSGNGYEQSLAIIDEWLNDKDKNTRRAVIEGLRNWIKKPYFKDNPQEAIEILSRYKTDESEYVRRSVGNALKDISKTYPELIKNELNKWTFGTKEIELVHKLASKWLE